MESVGEGADLDRLKLKSNPWNSDKEDFTIWMMGVTAVVRSLRHGNEIEDWLDVKLDRDLHQAMMVSSLITDDPDFDIPEQMIRIIDEEGSTKQNTTEPQSVARSLFRDTPRTVRSVKSLRVAENATGTMKSPT